MVRYVHTYLTINQCLRLPSRKVERVHLTREENAFKITAAIKQTDITQSNKYGEGNLLGPHQCSEKISIFLVLSPTRDPAWFTNGKKIYSLRPLIFKHLNPFFGVTLLQMQRSTELKRKRYLISVLEDFLFCSQKCVQFSLLYIRSHLQTFHQFVGLEGRR